MATIRCPNCNKGYPYRFSILKGVDQNTLALFRIPGLGYASSLVDGVGLVISGERLVGRFIYGTRACDCRNIETVVIGPESLYLQPILFTGSSLTSAPYDS